ncbi:MAG: thiol reductant ABC exporter subunit CydD [Rhodospirillum sp.]|nr:thiol reductant ABC exporter subunit CydD [Rhodospirillum sp.]MCF8490689.1 thiol reductant ABC exporter subunit CydD [Rhodospirillum sp.]MCF8502340.1 thiol reductant ABC exporter subunit CydD [Rhodospirillum sp.]
MSHPTLTPAAFLKSRRPLAGGLFPATVLIATCNGALLIPQAWLVASIAEAALFRDVPLEALWPRFWGLLALFLLRAVLTWTGERVAFAMAQRVGTAARAELLDHARALGPVALAGERVGALATSLVEGVEALEGYFARFLPAMITTVLIPLAVLVAVLPLDWISALVLAVTAPLIPFFMILIGKGAERLNQRQWARLTRMGARFLDAIQGLTTLKLFNASRREAETVSRMAEAYRRDTMSVLRVAFLSSLVLEFLATVSIALIAVFIGFRLFWGEMAFHRGLFILLLAPEFYLPLRNLGIHYHARMDAIGAADGMIRLLNRSPASRPAQGAPYQANTPVGLSFEEVTVTYDNGVKGLTGATFTVSPGEHVALAGPSGAGKSTLVNLLLRFVDPSAGRVLADGFPLDGLSVEDWRRSLAWVPQRPHLFQGSIADAIRLGSPDASLNLVEEAARQANAHGFIRALPEGYDQPIGEGGNRLSGGQVRRLALARAFLRDAPLLLLDEPTASLDGESEAAVLDALGRLTVGRTVLTIAHRPETLRAADRVVWLEGGRVVEGSGRRPLSGITDPREAESQKGGVA